MANYQITVQNKYIVVPVNMYGKRKRIHFYEGETLLWDFDAAIDFDTPHFYTYVDISHLMGKAVTLVPAPEIDLRFTFTDAIPTAGYYHEELRPMVHFTPKIGWLNDPNGLVCVDGVYHLFFQHNPADTNWGNMHWGHAISNDLIHWHELDAALKPDRLGTMFSGSGIIDRRNASGLQQGEKPPVLVFYTACGGANALSAGKPSTQCMAYSNDGGMTFTKYAHNPVIPHITGGNRDPKVIWCEELGCYVLALYLDQIEYALFTSRDLLRFAELQRIHLRGDGECPDFYPLEVENEAGVRKWVFIGAADHYLVGTFQKGRFVPDQEIKPYISGHRTSYASQSFSDVPGRRIRIAWDTQSVPETVFNCQMGIPTEVSLRKVGSEYRLRTLPVREFESIRVESSMLSAHDPIRHRLQRRAYDVEITAPKGSPDFAVRFFGYELKVKPSDNTLCFDDVVMPLSYTGGDIHLRLISDTVSLEIFADEGLLYAVSGARADYSLCYLTVEPLDGTVRPEAVIRIHTLKGIW